MGLRDFEDDVRRQGFDYLPILEGLCPKGFMQRFAVSNHVDNFSAVLRQADSAKRPLDLQRDIEAIVRRIQPELFVIDLLLTDMALLAENVGVPFILLNTQLFNPWVEYAERYRRLLNKTELILCPQEFDFPDARRKKDSYYVEASIDLEREDAPFPWGRLAEDKPLVYCSFGSQNHLIEGSKQLFQTILEAFKTRPELQLVLSAGSFNVDEFPDPPANAILVKTAPQLEILKRASLMITHGGFNSVKECIYFGVPMILFSVIRDHPAIAARVGYHGLGVMGDMRKATVARIHALLDRVIKNSSFRSRAAALSKVFREAEASSPSFHVIENFLGNVAKRRRMPDYDVAPLTATV
jgi:UDP:flavonoid glycosyltransferase YjiC (YdhE family)